MIFKKIRNNFSLLFDSSRHVWIFELAYKLVAFAVIFPLLLLAVNACLNIAGVNYLTNEYIKRALTHPVVIIAVFLAICAFVLYCTYACLCEHIGVCARWRRMA